MFNLDHILRVATAAAGAIVLSAVTIGATVGPEVLAHPGQQEFAQAAPEQAHG